MIEAGRMMSPEIILIRVASHYGVPVQEVRGKRRFAQLALARHVAMWLMRQYTCMSYADLGNYFDIDHTTAIHGVRKIENFFRWDKTAERTFRSIVETQESHGSGI